MACRGPKWRLESRACEGFWPDETGVLRARRSRDKGRASREGFMQRSGLVEVESEAGVAQRRAVRRRAWRCRRLGSSRVSGSDRWTVMPAWLCFSVSHRAVAGTAATAQRGCGWRGIQSCESARSLVAADGAGNGAGTPRHPGS